MTRETEPPRKRVTARLRLRNYFLTGIVVAAPISITVYLTWTFINWVDGWAKPLIPRVYNPDTYLPIPVPGVGLVFALVLITLLGFLTANLVGRTIVTYGEALLDRMPLVRNLYRGLKQIFHTALSESSRSFQKVGLIEYPRKGLWAIIFVSTDAKGEVAERLTDNGEMVSVFLPTTPNPTSGFLLFVPRSDVTILDMSVEEAAKLVISAGLVAPEPEDRAAARSRKNRDKDKSAPIAAE
ncbi:MAG: DUF502 domain-containing protein [Hyphomicrobiales bacterium]|nr:DUF502 domain-containing protein [Hyphomicrobiales bacterium]